MAREDGFETLAIHAGQEPDPLTGAVVPPIYQVSTYKQDGVGGLRGGAVSAGAAAGRGDAGAKDAGAKDAGAEDAGAKDAGAGEAAGAGADSAGAEDVAGAFRGYEYSRTANPTRAALEECLAALEGGTRALAFASGMAAEDCLLRTVCSPGDHVLIPDDAYGGTFRLFSKVYEQWGISYAPVRIGDTAAVREALAAGRARVIWVETPTNPLLGIADVSALAGLARDAGALLVVDNTFASPYLQRPIPLGADVVVHSTTKYLGGHSDVVGGALVVADAGLGERLAFHQNAMGAISGAFDAWLTLRGIRTLAVRMDRHCANAARIAEMLAAHPAAGLVLYPGLASHPGHELAVKQMRGFGGMVSFRVRAGAREAAAVCARTRLFTLAESLGGVESLIELPGRMTHASAAGSPLAVPEDLIRLSVGIENADDLVEDLRQALG